MGRGQLGLIAMNNSTTNHSPITKAPETKALPRGVAEAMKEASRLRYKAAAGKILRVSQEHIVDLDDYAHTLQSSYDSLARELEQSRKALAKYGDHSPECAVIQECGRAVKPPCNCGFDAALKVKPSNEVGT